MKVQIRSDVVCPFCYIGKRRFEQALAQFPHANEIEIERKSFQLDPTIPQNQEPLAYHSYLAKKRGISQEQSQQMLQHVTQSAAQVGLEYNLNDAKVINTTKAHRIIQYAKTVGLGDQAEELLFYAYFTQGKNLMDDIQLTDVAQTIGLSDEQINTALSDDTYRNAMNTDIKQAQMIGVTGVPFFVFDNTNAVSGAHDSSVFLEMLEENFANRQSKQSDKSLQITQGESCDIDGNCA